MGCSLLLRQAGVYLGITIQASQNGSPDALGKLSQTRLSMFVLTNAKPIPQLAADFHEPQGFKMGPRAEVASWAVLESLLSQPYPW